MTHRRFPLPPRPLHRRSDSGGGAGIQADLKTIGALGCFGMTAITALTAQNTLGVRAIHAVPLQMLADQIDAVVEDIGVDAVKIGMRTRPTRCAPSPARWCGTAWARWCSIP